MEEALGALRTLRAHASDLKRGEIPKHSDFSSQTLLYLFGSVIFGAILGAIFWPLLFRHSEGGALHDAYLGAIVGFWLCGMWPLIKAIRFFLTHFRLPPPGFLATFRDGQKALCVLLTAWVLTWGINAAYPWVVNPWQSKAWPWVTSTLPLHTTPLQSDNNKKQEKSAKTATSAYHTHPSARDIGARKPTGQNRQEATKNQISPKPATPTIPWYINVVLWLCLASGVTHIVTKVSAYRAKRYHARMAKTSTSQLPALSTLPFRLWLGESTGTLANRSHGANIAPRQGVTLPLADACQNILVLGAIGSGKTTRAMHPLLMQLLDQNCGGLIFDVKADFERAVQAMAKTVGKEVTVIGVGHYGINLLAGLSPEVAASFLKSLFLLNGKHSGDSFWTETATELCRNILGILSFLPDNYHLQGLYRYIFDREYQVLIDDKLMSIYQDLPESQRRHLEAYSNYQSQIFDKFDDKVKASVHATVAQVLSPFNHPSLIEAFCESSAKQIDLHGLLDGNICLVNLPLSIWGLGGKIVYTLIKLRFYNLMQRRLSEPTWNQDRPVFFMCDEFQEIVSANQDGLSDLNFWDKSRSSKTIGIISGQAISSFYAAIGSHDLTHALLQNFRQKICFRTEDLTTLKYFNDLTDKVEVEKITYSHTSGKQKHHEQTFASKSSSSTENISFVEKTILNPQLFRQLNPNQAVAMLSVNGISMDDVLEVMPILI
jgi:type IV secretory pathway TraG/TraD family ATPase VirD4